MENDPREIELDFNNSSEKDSSEAAGPVENAGLAAGENINPAAAAAAAAVEDDAVPVPA